MAMTTWKTSCATLSATAAVALMLSASLPHSAMAQSRSHGGILDRLAEIGIGPEQVVEINVYAQNESSEGRSRGSTAWIKVEQCPNGFVVMDVGRTGTVTSAWTHGDCDIPELDC